MKDLMFLLIVLGLITFGMIATQGQYRGEERDKTQQWERQTYGEERQRKRKIKKSPSPTPTVTPSPKDSSHRISTAA